MKFPSSELAAARKVDDDQTISEHVELRLGRPLPLGVGPWPATSILQPSSRIARLIVGRSHSCVFLDSVCTVRRNSSPNSPCPSIEGFVIARLSHSSRLYHHRHTPRHMACHTRPLFAKMSPSKAHTRFPTFEIFGTVCNGAVVRVEG